MVSSEESPVQRWSRGDRVRVDIPDESRPDHRRLHGRHGEVIAVIPLASGGETDGDPPGYKYRIRFDAGGYADLQWYDLRPPIVT